MVASRTVFFTQKFRLFPLRYEVEKSIQFNKLDQESAKEEAQPYS
jgi:hypothetical protein